MAVAIADAYRSVNVTTTTGTPGVTTTNQVGGTLNLDAGFGISLVADPGNNKVTIVNTGNGTGALTTITNINSNATYYPIFTRAPASTVTYSVGSADYTTVNVFNGTASVRITGSNATVYGISPALSAAITGLQNGITFSGVRTTGGATLTFTATGPGTFSTGLGYWTIPVSAAPAVTDTLTSVTMPSGSGSVNPITGTYQMDTMYLDQTVNPLTYNPGSSTLTCSTFVGALTGNASTASSSPTSGLTGTSLPAAIVTSSLTTVGTVDTGTWSASFGAVSGANLTNITAGNLSGTISTGVLGNSSLYVGTTQIALNRGSAVQSLTGVSIDGNAGTVTNGFYTSSSFNLGTTSIAVNRTSVAQSLTGINIDGSAGSATKATNLAGGNATTLLGSIGYQSGVDTTTLLSPNTTATKKFLRQTGDGTNGTAPAWDTLVAGDIPAFNLGTTSVTFNRTSVSQSLTGISIDGNAATVTNGFYTTSTFNLGTTSVAVNRTSASQSLTGVSIDGNAGTATNLAGGFIGSIPYQTGTGQTSFFSNIGTTPQFVSSQGNGVSALAPGLVSSTGTGNVVLSTNPTITAPTSGNASSTTDADATVDASTTEFYAYVQSATGTARTINISNLTAGRKVTLYLRNTNAATKVINIAASTTAASFASVNLSKGDAGGTSVTSVTLAATSGTATVTVFNASGVIGGYIS